MADRVADIRALIELCNAGSMKVFKGIKDEDFDFKPGDGMMSFSEHLFHISFVERHFLRKISGALGLGIDIPEIEPLPSLPDEINTLANTWQITDELLDRISDDDLEKPVPFDEPDVEINVRYLLHALAEHQVHHRGEIIVYFRMKGHCPPRRYRDDAPV